MSVGFAGFIAKKKTTLQRAGRTCVALIGSTLLLSACALEPSNISGDFKLNKTNAHVTGAKARIIYGQSPGFGSRPGAIYPQEVVCVEPHPDVTASVASSFGLSASVQKYGAAGINASTADSIAQIAKRTVSIQALQRLMFRACEAYSNGAITGTSYSMLLSEINKTMVTLVLSETAGGRFGAAGASSVSEAGGNASAKLTEQTTPEATTDQAAAPQQAVEQQPAATTPGTTPSTAPRTSTADVKAETTTKTLEVKGLGSITPKGDADIARVIADMQENYLGSGNVQNYIAACLVELGQGDESVDDDADKLQALNGLNKELLESFKFKVGSLGAYSQLGAIYRGYSLTRQSGLYTHCTKYLEAYLEAQNTYRTKALDNQAQLNTAMINAAKSIATSGQDTETARFAFCNFLPEATQRQDCLANLKK